METRRITVIHDDNVVIIDGEAKDGIDLSSLADNIHAIQWYGSDGEGELEICDPAKHHILVENRAINSFDDYAWIANLWDAASSNTPTQEDII